MEIILIVYLVVSIALIGIILLQQGKGAEMGASFGAGGANTVFGASGSGNALTKTTTILAILFFAIALTISYLNSETTVAKDEVIDVVATEEQKKEGGLESEAPVKENALESEAAPAKAAEKVEAKADDAAKSVEAKANEVKAEAEKAVETKKEELKDDTDN